MQKKTRILQVLFVIAVFLSTIAAYIFVPRPPADLSQYARTNGEYDVRIYRDTWGIPHVFGTTDPDAAFGLAYAHAEDDFLTIQQVLLAARGQLAAVYGMDAAPNDYMVQLLRIPQVVESGYERDLSADTRAVLEAYAEGLNTYAALHPDEVLLDTAFPVHGIDIAAGSVHRLPLFFGIDSVLGDLFKDERQSAVAVYGETSARWPENTTGENELAWAKSVAGSNTFAVGPSRTTDGSTMLTVNSHQPWEGPVAWYEAQVHSEEGWDMTGALFPGAPMIIHGHNRNLGWAFTVNDPDLTDVYVLEIHPDNENLYRFDGEWRELEVQQATLNVRIIGNLVIPVKQEVLWSVYGPVVRRPHGTYAVRFVGFGRVDMWEQFYRLNKAENFEEWRTAMAAGGLPMFNTVYADREGNIFYVYNGFLPVRAEGWDWSLYLPGNTSDTLWTEIHPFDRLPQVFNPAAGYIQNANSTPFRTSAGNNPSPEDFSRTLGIETSMTNRSLRLHELLGGGKSLSLEDFIAIKWDTQYSVESDVADFVALIRAQHYSDPTLQQGQRLLSGWDLRVDAENRAAALAVLMMMQINEDYAPFRGSSMVGLETPDDIVLQAFEKAVQDMMAQFGRLDMAWEDVNRLERGMLNIGLGGGPDILHAVYGVKKDNGRLRGVAGDGVVYVVRWLPNGEVESYSIHQYGSATLDADSPHYADQALLFVKRMLRPAWYDEADILDHLEAAYTPGD